MNLLTNLFLCALLPLLISSRCVDFRRVDQLTKEDFQGIDETLCGVRVTVNTADESECDAQFWLTYMEKENPEYKESLMKRTKEHPGAMETATTFVFPLDFPGHSIYTFFCEEDMCHTNVSFMETHLSEDYLIMPGHSALKWKKCIESCLGGVQRYIDEARNSDRARRAVGDENKDEGVSANTDAEPSVTSPGTPSDVLSPLATSTSDASTSLDGNDTMAGNGTAAASDKSGFGLTIAHYILIGMGALGLLCLICVIIGIVKLCQKPKYKKVDKDNGGTTGMTTDGE